MSGIFQSSKNDPIGYKTGAEARLAIREGSWRGPTAGMAPGFVQANLVILPEAYAFDFARFCFRNPKPCPLLDITEPGSPHPDSRWTKDADLRTDVPGYRLYENGELKAELPDLVKLWRSDFVSFLLGCSFTFEQALIAEGIPVRHQECGCNVPMYRTNISCQPAGIFRGPVVVSMRPIPGNLVAKAVSVTGGYPAVHGEPLYIGDAAGLGIEDLQHPDYGDPVPMYAHEVPVFWACGVTPQAVAQAAKIPLMITHSPGHMFITDRLNTELSKA
jgi:uncharacterized protein YcsI (UPF0317 family)